MQFYAIYNTTYGLKNSASEVIEYSAKLGGFSYLEVADNVFVNDIGKIIPRFSLEQIGLGLKVEKAHRINSGVLFVSNGSIYKSGSSFRNETMVATGLDADLPVSFVTVLDTTYYSNGVTTGKYKDGVCGPWEMTDLTNYTGDREFSDPPAGTSLGYYNGRIYIASGNFLWFTEPHAYSLVALSTNFIPFEHEIQEILPVENGIFVVSSNNLYFLSGDSPEKFTVKYLSSNIVTGSLQKVQDFNTKIGPDNTSASDTNLKNGIFFVNSEGLTFCDDSADIINTFNTVDYGEDFNLEASSVLVNGIYIVKFKDGNAYCYNTKFGSVTRYIETEAVKYFSANNMIFYLLEDDVYVQLDSPSTAVDTYITFPYSNLSDNTVKKPRQFLIECFGTGSFKVILNASNGETVEKTISLSPTKRFEKVFIPRSIYGSDVSISISKSSGSMLYLSKIIMIANHRGISL